MAKYLNTKQTKRWKYWPELERIIISFDKSLTKNLNFEEQKSKTDYYSAHKTLQTLEA